MYTINNNHKVFNEVDTSQTYRIVSILMIKLFIFY